MSGIGSPQCLATRVALKRTNCPEWPFVKLDGIAGQVKPDETIFAAMRRAFEDETGLHMGEWVHFAQNVEQDASKVDYFWALGDVSKLGAVDGERIIHPRIKELPEIGATEDLTRLVTMALEHSRKSRPEWVPVGAEEGVGKEIETPIHSKLSFI
ncbi:MAG: NUDIX domain-containing protein [Opitutales bacterium]